MKITASLIDKVSDTMWEEALSKHGDYTAIPPSDHYAISETLRALYVLQIWEREGSQGNPGKFLRTYAVNDSMVDGLVAKYVGKTAPAEAPSEKRASRYDAFIKWSRDHIDEQFTTEQLTEQSGFSYPTTLKFLQESPYFRKVKRGVWEPCDPAKKKVAR